MVKVLKQGPFYRVFNGGYCYFSYYNKVLAIRAAKQMANGRRVVYGAGVVVDDLSPSEQHDLNTALFSGYNN